MKLRFAFLLLLVCPAAFAAIPLNAPTTYSQNFNTLPSATAGTWTDNTTISGWWLHRDGATITTPAPLSVSTGAGTWVANLYSLGAAGNTERALGSVPTTNHGTYSFIAIFQNTSTNPLRVSNIKFDVEVYRTNSTVNLAETLQFSQRIAATQADITSALATGWTTDTTMNYIYPGQATGSQVLPPAVAPVNRAPGTAITLQPGEHLGLRWSNSNDGGEDAYMGIDNVEIQFAQPACSITATASGITRNQNGTPGNPADDTFSFNVLVSGFGTGASGWRSTTGPSVTGAYGTSKAVTDVPIASNPLNFGIADVAIPTCTTSVNVSIPITELALTATNTINLPFTAPPVLAQSYVRTSDNGEPGWTGGTAAARVQVQPAPNSKAKYFDINLARPTFTTEAINIASVSEFVAGIELAAYTTSDTTFETPDTFTVTVQTATAASGPWTSAGVILNATDGAALFTQIRVANPGIAYAAGSFPAADFPFVRFRSGAIQRGAANYARLVTVGGNDSASEHLLLDNISFAVPVCTLLARPTVTRNNQGDENPANDTFTASVIINAEFNQGNTQWNSDAIPASGRYSPVTPTIFGPYLVSEGPKTVTFTDSADPGCSVTVSLSPPPPILRADIINVTRDERSTVTLNDDSISFLLTMTATDGSSGWTSNIPVPGAPGTVYNGNYGDAYTIVADVATMPDDPRIMDRAITSAYISVVSYLPSPKVYVIGELITIGAPPVLVPSIQLPDVPPGGIPNGWQNLTNGVITQSAGLGTATHFIESDSNVLNLENIGEVQFSAELVVTETSTTSNLETNDVFKAFLGWVENDLQYGVNLIDLYDSNGNGILNGYTDTAATPYNNNRLLDEFNRPAPGQLLAGPVSHTFLLTATIPAGATFAVLNFEGLNDSLDEQFRLQNVRFVEKGANVSNDNDGDGVSNTDEDIMGTDKFDAASVLRLVQNPANPNEFTFAGAGGRFYRVYQSDDADEATHMAKWVDAGLGTVQDAGPHTVNVATLPGESRRFFRVRVMQSNGPWPATVP